LARASHTHTVTVDGLSITALIVRRHVSSVVARSLSDGRDGSEFGLTAGNGVTSGGSTSTPGGAKSQAGDISSGGTGSPSSVGVYERCSVARSKRIAKGGASCRWLRGDGKEGTRGQKNE
jgi:hypothetical protein